jgi:hypothetical protein
VPNPVPTTFQTQRTLLRKLALATFLQENFSESLPDAAFTYASLLETNNFANIESEWETNYNYAGKGSSFASDMREITRRSAMEISTRLDQFLAGYLLFMVMGNDVVTGAAAPYSHVLTFLDSNVPALVTNLFVEDTSAFNRRFLDMALSQLVLTGSEKGSIMAKASFMGTGRYVDGALAAMPAIIQHPQFLYGSQAIVSIGPQGAPVAMNPRVLSWEATFDHAVEEFRAPGGSLAGENGLFPAFMRFGNPTTKLKLVIAADTSTDVRDWRMNQTALEVKIAVTSGAASLTLDYPHVQLPKDDLGETNKYVAYTIDLDQNSILQDPGSQPVTATVVNSVASYSAAE